MFAHILPKMQAKVRTREIVVTLLVEEEMTNNGLTIFDLENIILTGEVIERQKHDDRSEWNYLLSGQTLGGNKVIVMASFSPTGKLLIISIETRHSSSIWSRIRAFWRSRRH